MKEQYNALRRKWKEKLIGGIYESTDEEITKIVQKTAQEAEEIWSTMNKEEEVPLWVPPPDPHEKSRKITFTYNRLYKMAMALTQKGSHLYGNEKLIEDVVFGLEWMDHKWYNASNEPYGNWWHWEIGTPQVLSNMLILLHQYLTKDQITRYTSAIKHHMPDTWKWRDDGPYRGANRLDLAIVEAVCGLALEDEVRIENSLKSLSMELRFVVNPKKDLETDGFYEDGSYIQHRDIPYTAGYGQFTLRVISDMIYLYQGSKWELKDKQLWFVEHFIEHSYIPIIHKGIAMDMVRGRKMARSMDTDHRVGHYIIGSILQYALTKKTPWTDKIKSILKYWLLSDTYRQYNGDKNIYFILLVRRFMNDEAIKPRCPKIQHKRYPSMDRVVHIRPNYTFAISMFSSRIRNHTTVNVENLKGWYTSSGMSYLYNNDLSQYTDHYWPTVNPYRLPGTTLDTMEREAKVYTGEICSTKDFVGGTSLLDLYGVTGMELEQWESSLQAKKSWFMFDDEVVCVGSAISSQDGRTIETIIENRQLRDKGDHLLKVNGQEFSANHHAEKVCEKVKHVFLEGKVEGSQIGYYFPQETTIHMCKEKRSGAWSDLGILEPQEQHEKVYATMWLSHGINPSNGKYDYVLLPGKTKEEVAAYASCPDIQVISNTEETHCVYKKSLELVGVNFWSTHGGEVKGLKCSTKASAMCMIKENVLYLSVSDPTMKNQEWINIDIDQKALNIMSQDEKIEVLQLEPNIQCRVNVHKAKGRSFEASFQLKDRIV